MPAAIEVMDLRKSYGETEALRGVSFEVAAARSSTGLRSRTAIAVAIMRAFVEDC